MPSVNGQGQPPSHQKSLKESRSTSKTITTCYVGPRQEAFVIHRSLLISNSSYLSRTLTDESNTEAKSGEIYLSEEDSHSFAIFNHWIYHGVIDIGLLRKASTTGAQQGNIRDDTNSAIGPLEIGFGFENRNSMVRQSVLSTHPQLTREDWPTVIIKAYLLGETLESSPFKNALVNTMIQWSNSERELPDEHEVRLTFESLPEGKECPMKKLLVDLIFAKADKATLEIYINDRPDVEFVAGIARNMLRRTKLPQMDEFPERVACKKYHEHDGVPGNCGES